jgi:hypothetical protein
MSDIEIARRFKEIFGVRGFKGAARIMKALGTEDFENLQEAIYKATGRTDELAAQMRDTAANETLQMKSAIESLQKVLGDELAPALKVLKALVKDTATAIAGFARRHPILTRVVMMTVGALALLFTGLTGLLFTLAAVSSLVSLVAAPAFLAGAAAAWAFAAPILATIGAVALFAIGINALIVAIAMLIVHKQRVHQAFEDFFLDLGMYAGAAKVWAEATMSAIELLLGPLYAVSNAINEITTNWEGLQALGRGAFETFMPGAGLFAPPTPAALPAGAGGGEVGGTVEVRVKSDLPATVTELASEGPVDIVADVGRTMAGAL